ncbi:MAG: sulfotransferase [Phycisphaerales bacterium]
MGQFNQNAPVLTAYHRSVMNCKNLIDSGQYDAAIAMLKELRQQQPRDTSVLRMLGHAMMMVDMREESIRNLEFASKLEPNNAELYVDLASAYRRVDQIRKAHQSVDAALKISPAHPRAVMAKARLLQSHGSTEQAYELIKTTLETQRDPEVVAVFGQLCRELKRQHEAIDLLRTALTDPSLRRPNRQDLLFSLGHLLDSVGEYDEAFGCFQKGNTMSAEYPQFDVDRWKEIWNKDDYDKIPVGDVDGSRCVFIVGMPRSGTTLTEQIIASHPSADGIGEGDYIDKFARLRSLETVDKEYLNKAAKGYHEFIAREVSNKDAKRICDKMPENYYFSAFITKALPGSKIIHCQRNPIDTCLSIYFQRFGPRIVYATDLGNCADQYLKYLQVIAHVQNELGVEMLDAPYEQTTADPEPSIRRMLDYVGLPFDEACMDFHKSKKSVHTASVSQVRQPLYKTSANRWKHYEKHIGPLIDKLGHLIED